MDFDKKRGNGRSFFDRYNTEERFLVDVFSKITERLKQKFSYTDEEILRIWGNELLVPVAIFSGKLSPAEALSKFLKENHDLSFVEISKLIGRNSRSVWANYKRAKAKMPWPFEINDSIAVPVSVFNSEKSMLEALVSYLKDVKRMRNRKIAKLLNKAPANVWTAYSRARKKDEK